MEGTALIAVCLLLMLAWAVLAARLGAVHKAGAEIAAQMEERAGQETNVGIDISTSDKSMRRLAAGLDLQLRQLREKQIQYNQGDQELKTAISNISHDLRTPLTAVCGYLDLLKDEPVSAEVREYLNIIEDRTERMRELTEEFFRYSLLRSVRLPEEREEISISRMIEETAVAYYGSFKEAGITPDIRLPERPVTRVLNRQALSRILENIISNGIKYSEGDFHIILQEDGRLYFKNRTARLDKVRVARLFNRFYTVEAAGEGTGLGLSIARPLTEAMGGRIQAKYQEGILCILLEFPFS